MSRRLPTLGELVDTPPAGDRGVQALALDGARVVGLVLDLEDGTTRCVSLPPDSALGLARQLLAAIPPNELPSKVYGSTEWWTVGQVAKRLRISRRTAQRLLDRRSFRTTHRRAPGGARYVAADEVEAWAAGIVHHRRRR